MIKSFDFYFRENSQVLLHKINIESICKSSNWRASLPIRTQKKPLKSSKSHKFQMWNNNTSMESVLDLIKIREEHCKSSGKKERGFYYHVTPYESLEEQLMQGFLRK